MDETQRDFLFDLVDAPSPSGFETAAQRVWVDYVSEFADEVRTDAYGNAVAVHEGAESDGGPDIAFAGHADEIGFMVSKISDDGFLRITPIGAVDRTVTEGTQIEIHTDDGVVNGVIGQTAIHLRGGEAETTEVSAQHVGRFYLHPGR